MREGRFFKRKIIRSIGLTMFRKNLKKQNFPKLQISVFCEILSIFLDFSQSPIVLNIFLLKKCPFRTGFDRLHHRSATILTGPFMGFLGFHENKQQVFETS